MNEFRACCLVPTFNNPLTLRQTVERVRAYLPDVLVVDDGSDEPGRLAAESIKADGLARLWRRPKNGGKGAAVKTGLAWALELGYTHAVQIDADGQHAVDDIPGFLDLARKEPRALIVGAPIFDDTVPRARLHGRRITCFWTNIETGGRVITDPLCGFRVYPLDTAVQANARGDRMDFDPEIAVRLCWLGAPVINVPTRIRYLSAAEGGVSHFRLFSDNLRISWMHTRLVTEALLHALKAYIHRGTGGKDP